MPSWDRERRRSSASDDPLERAILDIEFAEANELRWIDVSVRHPAAGAATELLSWTRRAGEATRRGEREKRERYPGNQRTTSVVEVLGRLGGEARPWVFQVQELLREDLWAVELARDYKTASWVVQSRQALQLRAASGLK